MRGSSTQNAAVRRLLRNTLHVQAGQDLFERSFQAFAIVRCRASQLHTIARPTLKQTLTQTGAICTVWVVPIVAAAKRYLRHSIRC